MHLISGMSTTTLSEKQRSLVMFERSSSLTHWNLILNIAHKIAFNSYLKCVTSKHNEILVMEFLYYRNQIVKIISEEVPKGNNIGPHNCCNQNWKCSGWEQTCSHDFEHTKLPPGLNIYINFPFHSYYNNTNKKETLLQCRGAENYLCQHLQPWLQRISV